MSQFIVLVNLSSLWNNTTLHKTRKKAARLVVCFDIAGSSLYTFFIKCGSINFPKLPYTEEFETLSDKMVAKAAQKSCVKLKLISFFVTYQISKFTNLKNYIKL